MSEATRPEWPSIPALLVASERRHAERVAVVDASTALTYPELVAAARRFAAALIESGIGPGDRVAIWCFNCAEWVVAALGVFAAGAVLVPVNTRFKGHEAADILRRSGARTLVTVKDFLGTDYLALLEDAGVPLPALETVVLARGRADHATDPVASSDARLDQGGGEPPSFGGELRVGESGRTVDYGDPLGMAPFGIGQQRRNRRPVRPCHPGHARPGPGRVRAFENVPLSTQ